VRVIDGETLLSPSDVVSFAACGHLAQLERAAAANLVQKPIFADPAFDLLVQRGKEHEERYLAALEVSASGGPDEGGAQRLTRIAVDHEGSLPGVEAAASATEAAMRRGDAVIYQATFLQPDGGATWRGHADFLLRVDTPSDLGAWSYGPADAKLARAAKVGAVLQLCAYAELTARIQGRLPEHVRLILGGPGHPEERIRLADFHAYYRRNEDGLLGGARARRASVPARGHVPGARREVRYLQLVQRVRQATARRRSPVACGGHHASPARGAGRYDRGGPRQAG